MSHQSPRFHVSVLVITAFSISPFPVLAQELAADAFGKSIASGDKQENDRRTITLTLNEFPRTLAEHLSDASEADVLLDRVGLDLAKVNPESSVTIELAGRPFPAAIRAALGPMGLTLKKTEKGVMITADLEELARRGIAVDRWVGLDPAFSRKLAAAMETPLSESLIDLPLVEVVRHFSSEIDLPVLIARNALEDNGISVDDSISLSISETPAFDVMSLAFERLDLTLTLNHGVLTVTSHEAAEEQLLTRIYYLEGLGFDGDFDALTRTICSTIKPDTWQSLGGVSVVTAMTWTDRPGIVVTTTYDVHRKLEALLKSARETTTKAETFFSIKGSSPFDTRPANPKQPVDQGGGMF